MSSILNLDYESIHSRAEDFSNTKHRESFDVVVSRAVAKDNSVQEFNSVLIGENECFGHVECDGILSDKAVVSSTPTIVAKNKDAMLVHEAAIGKISEEQQNKLMTLGLSKEEAEQVIIQGFLS